MSKDHETIASISFGMVAMQMASVHFFGARLQPDVIITDFSDGLRTGTQYIMFDVEHPEAEMQVHAAVM